MVSLSFIFSLSVCTVTRTLSVCFSLSLSLSISTSPSLLLSISFPLSFFCSPLLPFKNSNYFLLFIYLVLLALLNSSFDNYIYFVVSMPMSLLLLLIRIRSPQLLSMLRTAQRQPQQKEFNIMSKIEMRGKMDNWVG